MEKVLDLKKRIIDICYKHKISHITSYITSVGIIDYIYNLKKDNDIFILSSGHCALAYYVVLEKYLNKNAEELFLKHGGHPHYDISNDIHCSTGSLGLGITIAVGYALSNKNRDVYFNLPNNKTKMLTVPFGEDASDIVASYMQTDEGVETYKLLNKILKGDSKPRTKKKKAKSEED